MNGKLAEDLDEEIMKFNDVMWTSHAIEVTSNDIEKAVESVHHFVSARLRSSSDGVVQQKMSITALYKSLIEKALRNMVDHRGTTVVVIVVTVNSVNSFKDWISFIKYCRNRIPKATGVLAVYNDNVFSATPSFHHLQGFDAAEPTFEIVNVNESIRLNQETDMVQENVRVSKQNDEDDEISTFGDDFFASGINSSSESGISSSSSSFSVTDLPPLAFGWPLLKISSSLHSNNQAESDRRGRDQEACCTTALPISLVGTKPSFCFNNDDGDKSSIERRTRACSPELPEKLELVLKKNHSSCRMFSYEELRIASADFSTGKLIGEGGCSHVYKGTIDGEKPVAIKVLKSYKEAWDDFTLEIEIVACLKNKHITTLIGVCLEENHIISVYEYLPKGSLDDHLHGTKGSKAVMPWKARFKAAIVVAEALNYLHNECETPVIHRDVKSSNILLSDAFQAKLSDFGLAIQGPKDSTFLSHVNVVGTFGYVAPEYFMHGRVSDRVDVYSFGVVLLELLSGKRPIGVPNTRTGQENLIKWAKSLIDSGKLKALMDPKLNGVFDIAEMHRMVLAATLCITPSPRLRPNISQILQVLKGEKDKEEWLKSHIANIKASRTSRDDDDEMYSKFCSSRRLDFAFLDLEDDDTCTSVNANLQHRKRIKDFLKEPQD